MNSARPSDMDMICGGGTCKQRFKGVENFLRKVAFNLGNSPSQTEVKIISCIPIDVTDLQQKIVSLERELDEVKSRKRAECTVATANAAPAPPMGRAPAAAPPPAPPPNPAPSPVPCACSLHGSQSDFRIQNDCGCFSRELNTSSLYNQQMETETQCNTKMIKRGKIKNALKKRGRSHFVYYAQTESGPFTTYQNQKREAVNATFEAKDVGISRTYISEMIQKQYAAAPFVEEFPITSQISSPVCRDLDPSPGQLQFKTNKNDSEVCSCLQGTFYNIDKHPTNRFDDKHKLNLQPSCSYSNESNNTDFYDTSLYDMVPVKEKPVRPPHLVQDITITKRRLRNAENDATYFPERNRQKYRYHPFYPKEKTLYVYNSKTLDDSPISQKKTLIKLGEKKAKYAKETPNIKREEVMRELERNHDTNCSFDCGNIYVKKVQPKVKQQPVVKPVPIVSHKNAECLTNNVKDMDCQTTTSQSVQIDDELLHDDKKTEDTLAQIKLILQTVLTEVKTNTQVKKNPEEKPKKDAVVQKGMSQGMMPGCSTMLNSFTYSPYNMNPYMPSCSQQVSPCYPNMPYMSGKYMHNYPVFIQSPMRNMCSCYKNTAILTKEVKPKPATTATNTESNETHKLIKEIYKSIKVNMDMPVKDTSASECEGLKSRPPSFEVNSLQEAVNLLKTSNTDSKKSAPQKYSSLNFNKLNSNTVSLRSQMVSSTDTENYLRNKRIDSYLENLKLQTAIQNRIEEEYEANLPSTEASDVERVQVDTRSPVEESEKKVEKRGLFSKMFGPLKLFKSKPKKKEEQIQVENESESEGSETESEGYQTVYSQEMIRAPSGMYPVRTPLRPRVHSKLSFARQWRDRNQDRYRRSPYMDQEYRRQWDDKLMFRENQRHSTEASRSRDSGSHASSPMYWRGYEARSALTAERRAPGADRQDRDRVGTERGSRPRRFVNASIAPSLPAHVRNKGVTLRIPKKNGGPKVTARGFTWLKKHKPACAGQWKKVILES